MKNINNIIFVRKSKWLLFLITLKIIFIIFLLIFVFHFFWFLIKKFGTEIEPTLILISYLLVIWWYFSSIIPITKYFFNFLIITENYVYKYKIWLFFTEDMSIVELYRIQEVKAYSDGFFRVLLDIWDLHLVEQKDKEKIIHWIDHPNQVAKIIEEMKNKAIKNRFKINKKEND